MQISDNLNYSSIFFHIEGDLSHSCKPLELHKQWTARINEEFCVQGNQWGKMLAK